MLDAEARAAHPLECCGILYGSPTHVTHAEPAANVHLTPATRFELDPAALIAAYRAEREGGRHIVGYYHSHPTGVAEPSATDRAMAPGDGKIWAIVTAGEIRFWRDGEQGFQPLSYLVANP